MSVFCTYMVGLLRDDVLELKNVEYVCGTIESLPALHAIKRITESNGRHLSECDSKSHDASDYTGSVESMTRVNAKNILRNSGLRVAVCDVNTGSVAAATLLSTFVLPHMKDACRCRCFDNDGKNYTRSNNISSRSRSRSDRSADNASKNDIDEYDNGNDKNNDDYDKRNGSNSVNIIRNSSNRNKSVNLNTSVNSVENIVSHMVNLPTDENMSIKNSTNDIEKHSDHITNNEEKDEYYIKNRRCHCGGYVVLTLKLVKNAKESYIKNAVDSASIILASAGCYDFHTVHLGANSRNERSLICRFK